MKKIAVVGAVALALAALLSGCRAAQGPQRSGVVRLHIVANSDRAVDQSEKLRVRDALMVEFSARFADLDDADCAWNTLGEVKDEMAAAVETLLRQDGFAYGARITLATEAFPARNYMGRVWPTGEYRTVRVLLGEAAGKNWWCVMYPPLCIADTVGDVDMEKYYDQIRGMSDPEEDPPKAPVRSYFFDRWWKGEDWDAWFAKMTKKFLG
ncbi:MAG: stage II sporulation protein R [Eubacteriales bacterium]|nr:stage II sporulation protein R [Eubacteriales bacterium]